MRARAAERPISGSRWTRGWTRSTRRVTRWGEGWARGSHPACTFPGAERDLATRAAACRRRQCGASVRRPDRLWPGRRCRRGTPQAARAADLRPDGLAARRESRRGRGIAVYVRDRVAVTTAERAAARADAGANDVRALAVPMRNQGVRGNGIEDLDAVMRIENEAYPVPWTRGNFLDSLASGCLAQCLTDGHGLLLGYWVAMRGGDELHLLNLTVAPAAQRCGHGRRCWSASQRWESRRVYGNSGSRFAQATSVRARCTVASDSPKSACARPTIRRSRRRTARRGSARTPLR